MSPSVSWASCMELLLSDERSINSFKSTGGESLRTSERRSSNQHTITKTVDGPLLSFGPRDGKREGMKNLLTEMA
jgi:hypothetical protein